MDNYKGDEQADKELSKVMYRATRALDEAGLTVQDIIDDLPSIGQSLMRQWYGDSFVDELERQYEVTHPRSPAY